MARLLFLMFLIVPMIEIGLFITLGGLIGLWPTLLGVVLTALIGSAIIRQQGVSILNEARQVAAKGGLPARQIADGMMLAIAGALLLTPGYFTDTIGFLLLVPAVRGFVYSQLRDRFSFSVVTPNQHYHGSPRNTDPDVIDLDSSDWSDDERR